MAAVTLSCPTCHAEVRPGCALDRRMLARFRDGVHFYCESCAGYRRMLPERDESKDAA
jgi:RNase P subunit RPR2